MPNKEPTTKPENRSKLTFRQRYDALERDRLTLIERLKQTGEAGRRHPSARKATTLLNRTFRNASIVQRVAILQAADWLISVIEIGSPML